MDILSACPSCGVLFVLAFLPSFVWLLFFWLQDKHREPKHIILSVFFWGFFIAIPVLLIELVGQYAVLPLFKAVGMEWLYGFFGIALIEEGAKYLVVRSKAVPRKDFDEPQDAMVYMMTAALGFAAIENFFYVRGVVLHMILIPTHAGIENPLVFLTSRFLTATFLHVIASGILGYFVALTFFSLEKESLWERMRMPRGYGLVWAGLVLSTTLHGLYNNFIIQEEGPSFGGGIPAIPVMILLGGGLFLLILYWHLRKLSR